MIEDGKFAGCTNYRYLLEFKERAANLGHEKAKEELDPLKKKVMNDSLEQFHLWFNTQGYEVAEDYASLAARCGSEEAETMLKVIDTQRKIVRDIAIDPYNQACKMVYAGIEDKGVFELFAKASGYGLTEAMYNAVVIYYDIAHKYDYDHRVQSRFFHPHQTAIPSALWDREEPAPLGGSARQSWQEMKTPPGGGRNAPMNSIIRHAATSILISASMKKITA